ncbi:hypothetical protein DL96DRAFT_1232241 [Flagelloscypha sp. PMI_526]|nr:hypothetical protein DL96DRAFT_1232241 [Flagelloscypha sp. PMI_526]
MSPPVSNLSGELLASIFSFCVPTTSKELNADLVRSKLSGSWLNFSYVCGPWRRAALACPTLWTSLPLSYPMWTLYMMERSKSAGLVIRTHCLYHDFANLREILKANEDKIVVLDVKANLPQLHLLISDLAFFPRLESLTLESLPPPGEIDVALDEIQISEALPNMLVPPEGADSTLSRITHLSLDNGLTFLDTLPVLLCTELTDLRIHLTNVSVEEVQVLAMLSHLTTLHISTDDMSPLVNSAAEVVTFPFLTGLTVELDAFAELLEFLRNVSLPSVRSIKVMGYLNGKTGKDNLILESCADHLKARIRSLSFTFSTAKLHITADSDICPMALDIRLLRDHHGRTPESIGQTLKTTLLRFTPHHECAIHIQGSEVDSFDAVKSTFPTLSTGDPLAAAWAVLGTKCSSLGKLTVYGTVATMSFIRIQTMMNMQHLGYSASYLGDRLFAEIRIACGSWSWSPRRAPLANLRHLSLDPASIYHGFVTHKWILHAFLWSRITLGFPLPCLDFRRPEDTIPRTGKGFKMAWDSNI